MPLSTDDRLAIVELGARYCQTFDLGDYEGWADCFTPDGVFVSVALQRFEGRQALRDFARQFALSGRQSRHWTNNPVIDGDGDTATATWYLMWATPGRPAVITGLGGYSDRLRKTAAGWRLVERVCTRLGDE